MGKKKNKKKATATPSPNPPAASAAPAAKVEQQQPAPAAPAPAPAPAPIAVVDDKELDKALAEQVAELKRNSVSGTQTLEQLQSSVSNGDAADPVRREESTDLPWDVASSGLKAFEDHYNADDTAFCGACYTNPCHVTVNGGSEQGGFGPFTTPDEVAAFMNALRNQLGGTNLHFTLQTTDHYLEPFGIASRQVISSKDTWVADNGTGSCDARWIHENGVWKMKSDVIMFTPSAAPVVDAQPVVELQAQAASPSTAQVAREAEQANASGESNDAGAAAPQLLAKTPSPKKDLGPEPDAVLPPRPANEKQPLLPRGENEEKKEESGCCCCIC